MMTNCTKSIILARVSTKEQEQNTSIPAQVERLENYARGKELEILKTYRLVESSSKDNRAKFEKLLRMVAEYSEPIAIVTDTVDRLQRSFKESVELDELRKQGKIEIHFCRENLVIHRDSNSSEIMRWDMAVMFAKMYVLQLSDNVKRSNQKKWASGEWCGQAPIGYLNTDKANSEKDIVPDEKRAPLVIKCFEMYATGNYTFKQIAKQMRKDGLTTPKTGTARHTSQIQHMITNPFYYGYMRVKGEMKPHRYKPLIEKWLFDRCDDVRNGRHKNLVQYASKPFTFRGMLKCAECGCIVTLDETLKKSGKLYRYARCPNSKGNCSNKKGIRVEKLEEKIAGILDNLQMPEDAQANVAAEMRKSHATESEIHQNNLDRIHLELEKIKGKKDSAYMDRLDGRITTDKYDSLVEIFKEQEAELHNELQELTKADSIFLKTSLTVLELAQNASAIFREAEDDQKRELLNYVTSNLTWNGEKLDYDLQEPFDVLLRAAKAKNWQGHQDSNPN